MHLHVLPIEIISIVHVMALLVLVILLYYFSLHVTKSSYIYFHCGQITNDANVMRDFKRKYDLRFLLQKQHRKKHKWWSYIFATLKRTF